MTELSMILKFDLQLVMTPVPDHMILLWIIGIIVLLLWTIWHFYIQRLLWHTDDRISNKENGHGHTDATDDSRGDGAAGFNSGTYERVEVQPRREIRSRKSKH